jgi:hypothetical protein
MWGYPEKLLLITTSYCVAICALKHCVWKQELKVSLARQKNQLHGTSWTQVVSITRDGRFTRRKENR